MKEKKRVWQYPWAYKESFLIAFAILSVGLLLDYSTNIDKINIAAPINFILIGVLIFQTVFAFFISKKVKHFKWVYSIEASISSITLFSILTMILALIPEKNLVEIGFANFRYSFTFFLSYAYFLIIIGATVLKRIKIRSIKDSAFFLNHFGLWFVLVAMGFGAGDIKHLNVAINKGETVWYATDEKGDTYDLNFAIQLNEFNIEFYNPKYGILENSTSELYKKKGKPFLLDLAEGESFEWEDKTFKLKRYVEAPKFEPGGGMRNLTAARGFFDIYENGKFIDSGWVSSGNEYMPPNRFSFNTKYSLVMTDPEPSLFESDVKIYMQTGDTLGGKISVNYPLTIGYYKVYQTSYEKSSNGYLSIFSVIYEPWLLYTYIGSFLMIFGSLYLVFSRIDLEKK